MTFTNLKDVVPFSKKLSVLYLEDDKDAAEATLDLFKNFFEDIDWAPNGKVGLEYFEQKKYDLVFVDLKMPLMNGVDFCRHILAHHAFVHITIISAYNDSEHYFEALQLGVHGYIGKPLDINKFTNTLKNVIEKVYYKYEFEANQKKLEEELAKKSQNERLKELELEFKSYHDELTGITNRFKLEQDLLILKDTDFLLIDINGFSHVNSIYGSHIGDLLLLEFTNILKEFSTAHSYTLYRIGGDHFAMLKLGENKLGGYPLAKSISEYFTANGVLIQTDDSSIELNISITIGVALNFFGHKLMEQAIEALKYAQKYSKSIFIYSEALGMEESHRKAFEALNILKKAIQADAIVPFFQPIKKPGGTAYESLVRVIEGDNVIGPNLFLQEIFNTSLYTKMTYTMIEKTFRYFEHMPNDFSINLSYKDIDNKNFLPWIKSEALRYNVAKRLIIEIVESEYLESFELVVRFINSLREIGVRFAIDDFGSAYSNFTYLLKLKPDFLKIDGSLIKDIDKNKESVAIVKAINSFAQDLNIQTIAEFIHSKEVYEKAHAIGIECFQGYYIGKPTPQIEAIHE